MPLRSANQRLRTTRLPRVCRRHPQVRRRWRPRRVHRPSHEVLSARRPLQKTAPTRILKKSAGVRSVTDTFELKGHCTIESLLLRQDSISLNDSVALIAQSGANPCEKLPTLVPPPQPRPRSWSPMRLPALWPPRPPPAGAACSVSSQAQRSSPSKPAITAATEAPTRSFIACVSFLKTCCLSSV